MTTTRPALIPRSRQLRYVLPLLISAAGCGASREAAPLDSQAPVEVTVDRVAMTSMPASFEAGGVLVSRQTAVIASRVLAPIAQIPVQPGERVRRGQVLVRLESDNLTAQAAQARAGLEVARANARAVTSDQAAAEAGVALARATHTRISRLHADRSATQQELDEATAALRQAEARLAAAGAQADATGRSIDAANAGVQAADIAKSWIVLTSPFDGIVAARHADPGSMASPGMPLLVIEASGSWQMDVRVDASRAAGLSVGQAAQVRVDGGSTDAWVQGKVGEIARVDPASHSFVVTIDLDPNPAWRSGLFGRARFEGPGTHRLGVSSDAVVTRGQLTLVYVVGADDHARLRAVSLGDRANGRTEVLAGLAEGDRVVVRPSPGLVDGGKVRAAAAPQRAGGQS
jgi:RND family efflux transporter MFP subunit